MAHSFSISTRSDRSLASWWWSWTAWLGEPRSWSFCHQAILWSGLSNWWSLRVINLWSCSNTSLLPEQLDHLYTELNYQWCPRRNRTLCGSSCRPLWTWHWLREYRGQTCSAFRLEYSWCFKTGVHTSLPSELKSPARWATHLPCTSPSWYSYQDWQTSRINLAREGSPLKESWKFRSISSLSRCEFGFLPTGCRRCCCFSSILRAKS